MAQHQGRPSPLGRRMSRRAEHEARGEAL